MDAVKSVVRVNYVGWHGGERLQQFTTPRCPVLSSNEVTQIRQNSENDVQGNYGAKTRTPLRGAGQV